MKTLKILISLLCISFFVNTISANETKKLAYIVSDNRIPFWNIMAKGITNSAKDKGYEVVIYSAQNNKKNEILNTLQAIKNKVSGIIMSPINSSTAVTILKMAKASNIPVVISDIGTEKGDFVSYISSNNFEGSYQIGKVLAKQMSEKNYINKKVGIIAIPQKRENGKLRTQGFMKAMSESNIKGTTIKQQITFSYNETYDYTKELISEYSDLGAIWLQGSNRYKAALAAIDDMGKKDEILLICFDAEPEFVDLISKGSLLGSAMQQPYLMGEESVLSIDRYLKGKSVQKEIQLPILAISKDNVRKKLAIINRNVLGMK